MEHLRPDQLANLQEVFASFAGEDGLLGGEQLSLLFLCLGLAMTEAQVADVLMSADSSGRGKLRFEEFAQLMTSPLRDVDHEAEAAATFAALDADGDGFINVPDLEAFVAKYSTNLYPDGMLPTSELEAIMKLSRPDLEALVKEAADARAPGLNRKDLATLLHTQLSVAPTSAPVAQAPSSSAS